MRRLLLSSIYDRADARARQELPAGTEMAAKTGKIAPRAITKSLKVPTITPYFGQSPVTLDWDNNSVASRPGPV
jgi:hypothetical protein